MQMILGMRMCGIKDSLYGKQFTPGRIKKLEGQIKKTLKDNPHVGAEFALEVAMLDLPYEIEVVGEGIARVKGWFIRRRPAYLFLQQHAGSLYVDVLPW